MRESSSSLSNAGVSHSVCGNWDGEGDGRERTKTLIGEMVNIYSGDCLTAFWSIRKETEI